MSVLRPPASPRSIKDLVARSPRKLSLTLTHKHSSSVAMRHKDVLTASPKRDSETRIPYSPRSASPRLSEPFSRARSNSASHLQPLSLASPKSLKQSKTHRPSHVVASPVAANRPWFSSASALPQIKQDLLPLFPRNDSVPINAEAASPLPTLTEMDRVLAESFAYRCRLRMKSVPRQMNILLLTNSHNSMSQAIYLELAALGHKVMVELAVTSDQMTKTAAVLKPDIIFCPFLTKVVPPEIYHHFPTFIVHPGVQGDRGMSSIDWALLEGQRVWGVTVMEAAEEMDAGPVWSTQEFAVESAADSIDSSAPQPVTKSAVYKSQGINAAIHAVHETLSKFTDGKPPTPLDYFDPKVRGCLKPTMKQKDCALDWSHSAESIAQRIASRDGQPGVLDNFGGIPVFVFGAHVEDGSGLNMTSAKLTAFSPKTIIAQRNGAVCVSAGNGKAVWITHMKQQNTSDQHFFKLPSTMVLPQSAIQNVPEVPANLTPSKTAQTWREIWYEVDRGTCYLHFDFYNGAMSTDQCKRLCAAIDEINALPNVDVVVFAGGKNYFSNGIHLNTIEASADPAAESMNNIVAIDEVCLRIMNMKDKLTISAMQGNAGAGGVMMAIAADRVYTHENVVMNPHYRLMGLFGSEYWTYNLPRRVGQPMAQALTEGAQPINAATAKNIGMIDGVIGANTGELAKGLRALISDLKQSPEFPMILSQKFRDHSSPEFQQKIQSCRNRELAMMRDNFRDNAYHQARINFVYKKPVTATPHHLVSLGGRVGTVMNGTAAANRFNKQIKADVDRFKAAGLRTPGLACIVVGSKADSHLFVKMKMKRAEDAGFQAFLTHMECPFENQIVGVESKEGELTEAQVTEMADRIATQIQAYNEDSNVDGILVQLPLPKPLEVHQKRLLSLIREDKDVDGLSPNHVGKMVGLQEPTVGDDTAFTTEASAAGEDSLEHTRFYIPCTVRGILELLKIHDVKLVGKLVTVVGASPLVGAPAAIALTRRHATVTTTHLHTDTRALKESVSRADIIISATGVPGVIKGEWIKQGAVVIDAGISVRLRSDGQPGTEVLGDVEYGTAKERASLITPVPGGVGPMTVSMLLQNTLDSYKTRSVSSGVAVPPEQQPRTPCA